MAKWARRQAGIKLSQGLKVLLVLACCKQRTITGHDGQLLKRGLLPRFQGAETKWVVDSDVGRLWYAEKVNITGAMGSRRKMHTISAQLRARLQRSKAWEHTWTYTCLRIACC